MEPIHKHSATIFGVCDFEEKATTSIVRACQEQNIVDVLDDDCWRHILNYVPVKDIVRSERVSQRWQALVHWYLLDTPVRLKIQTITNIWEVEKKDKWRECTINLNDNPILFYAVINKWAPFVVELIYDAKNSNEGTLRSIGAQCPNLENITLVRLKELSSCDWTAKFKRLKRLSFENCSMLDRCVTEFLKNNTIEELVIRMTDSVTGYFLQNGEHLKNIKTLILSRCSRLQYKHLLSAVEPINYLSGVTHLELRDLTDMIHVKAHLILDNMPQLEHLVLDSWWGWSMEITTAVTRLANLRYLGWGNGEELRGDELQTAFKDPNRLRAKQRIDNARTRTWQLQQTRLEDRRSALIASLDNMSDTRPEPDPPGVGIVRDFRR